MNSDEPLSVDAKRKLASLLKQASGRVFDIWGDFQVHIMDVIQDMGTRHANFERHEISMRKRSLTNFDWQTDRCRRETMANAGMPET